jgi:pentatricopeptide repeat protein
LEIFKRFVKKGGKPDSVMLGCLLKALALHGDWFESLILLHSGIAKPNIIAYNTVLHACAKAGEVDLCLGLLNSMYSRDHCPRPNVVSFTTVIGAFAPSGNWHQVLSLLNQMKETNISANAFTLTAASNAMLAGGKWRESIKLLDEIENDSGPAIDQVE